MATVSQSPTLRELQAVFGGNGYLRYYYRGGPYVPNVGQNGAVSTDPGSVRLSQFRGATNYVSLSASASSPSSFGSQKGTYTIGTSTCNISGGNGSVSYSLSFLSGTNFANTVSGNQATFRVTMATANTNPLRGTYRWTVSDGISSATTDFTVSWN